MSSGLLLAHPSCLFPVPFPSPLFPVPYSLFPVTWYLTPIRTATPQ